MAYRRRRFNWKARQQTGGGGNRGTSNHSVNYLIERKQDGYLAAGHQEESNALVLPSRKRTTRVEEENEDLNVGGLKRSKLTTRERKRLKKVLEAKVKKAKVLYSN